MRLKQSSRSSRTAWNLIVERCFLLTATPLRSGLGTGFVEHQSIAFPTPLPRGFGLNSPTPRAILRSNLTVRMSTLPPSARSILKTCSPPTSCRHAMAPSAHFHATHTPAIGTLAERLDLKGVACTRACSTLVAAANLQQHLAKLLPPGLSARVGKSRGAVALGPRGTAKLGPNVSSLQQALLRVSPRGCPSLLHPASAIQHSKLDKGIVHETHRKQEAFAAAQAVAEVLRKILKVEVWKLPERQLSPMPSPSHNWSHRPARPVPVPATTPLRFQSLQPAPASGAAWAT